MADALFATAGLSDHDGYLGHKVAALTISVVPVVAQLDPNDLTQRALLAGCGGLGALLVLISDRPASWHDFVARITGGVTSCFLFGPWLAARFGQETLNGLILTFGLVGATSWYLLGSATKGLAAFRESNGFWEAVAALARGRFRIELPDRKPPAGGGGGSPSSPSSPAGSSGPPTGSS